MLAALRLFADTVASRFIPACQGEPEDQLRGPLERLFTDVQSLFALGVVSHGEVRVNRLGKPDYAIEVNRLLAGYVELKAPGKGARTEKYAGHDKAQWERFRNLPNILYSDGNEWALYRDGERIDAVRLAGDITRDGAQAVAQAESAALARLFQEFLLWNPDPPTSARELARILAPLCRLFRVEVEEAMENPESPLRDLARDWRDLLFPDADDRKFADAYAQTVTFALLLARSEDADTLDLDACIKTLAGEHTLLSKALQVLTDPLARSEISTPLRLLQRVAGRIPARSLEAGERDPWLYFYEDFLAAYDPILRKNAGAYYTPVEVVRAQVRLVDALLRERLHRPSGFADPQVVTLDPAVGTGTYLLGIIEHVLGRVEEAQGSGAVPGQATALAHNVYGFEFMAGPYAVAELRVSRALTERGGSLPPRGAGIYLTDTLESPFSEPPRTPLFYRILAEQHQRALQVKDRAHVLVCIGNPPYDRHEAADNSNRARTGGWVRWGDFEDHADAILNSFIQPARDAGHGVHLKNIYNLYVYFWRWALWKIFEHRAAQGSGIISFITASSFLDGPGFVGMREQLRRECDDVWIIDLGGEGRGARREENVFAIQTPVAITIAMRHGEPQRDSPATVRYSRISGSKEAKLAFLNGITDFASLSWKECPSEWQAVFCPVGKGDFFSWPLALDVFPWQQPGVKAGRTWVIGQDASLLQARWKSLCSGSLDAKRSYFKESPTGRKIADTPTSLSPTHARLPAIRECSRDTPIHNIAPYSFRSLDRQHIIADARVIDRSSPPLWHTHSDKQIYITSLFSHPLGCGPALMACSNIPDLHHFRGSYGAKEVIPLFRDSRGETPNIAPGLLDLLSARVGRSITAPDLLAYIYGVLAHPSYTAHFVDELGCREVRVPISLDPGLFTRARDIGARLIWLHTYGQRLAPQGSIPGQAPQGAARCLAAVPDSRDSYPDEYSYEEATLTLHVGQGRFHPVSREVYEFEVSGFKVTQSWLAYRMRRGSGRRSSPLDDIRPERWTAQLTTELLELLWVLEATLAVYPEQEEVFSAIIAGPCLAARDLPPIPEAARKPPERETRQGRLV